jgi:Mg2+ and Co2+ transporter CorA
MHCYTPYVPFILHGLINVIAAVFLPITAIASVLSMDISSGVANTQGNFWRVLIAGIALGAGLASWVSRKRGQRS